MNTQRILPLLYIFFISNTETKLLEKKIHISSLYYGTHPGPGRCFLELIKIAFEDDETITSIVLCLANHKGI